MKKFFAVFFVLAALAGAGLFIGWAQRGVPPGSYGVLRSRSHGTDPRLVAPGEFRWVWYRLIPRNAQMSHFRLVPVNRQFSERGVLPSGRIFSAFLGIQEDFSWEISASMSFRLRPDALVALVDARDIRSQEELDRHLAEIADEMRAVVIRWFNQGSDAVRQADALLQVGEAPALSREIEMRFPSVADFSLRIISARLPDFGLYDQARTQHGEFLALQREHIAEGLAGLTMDRLGAFSRIAELELYGDLLTRFPILLEYLALEGRMARLE